MKIDDYKNHTCCKTRDDKIIVIEENKKILSIKNDNGKKIKICHVDGCLISSQNKKKCDYLIIIEEDNPNRFILLELKGTNYAYAIQQIIETAEHLNFSNIGKNIKKESFIIGSSHPKISTTMQKELMKYSKRFKAAGVSLPRPKSNRLEISI